MSDNRLIKPRMMLPRDQLPSVSVIIPCRNEETFIAACLESILANDYPNDRLEIFVADGMSRDGTRAIVTEYAHHHPHLKLLDNPKGTIPGAMNLGIRASMGALVLKMDAHSTYPSDYIAQCVRYLFAYQADMAGGVWSIAPRVPTSIGESIALALSHWFGSGNASIKTGLSEPSWADAAAFGCWRRETLTELGLFDERLAGSSDMDLNVRLRTRGGRILLVPDIRITYYADADLRSFWKHNFSDGVWVTYPLKLGKLACSWRHWIPFVFVSSILFSILAWKYVPIAAPLLLSIILAYGLINSASTVQVCFKSGKWRYLSILPYIFLARHVAHGLGAFYGLALVLLPVRAWTGRRSATAQSGYLGKRCLDMVGALVGLVVLSPVLAILSLFVKLTSPGPIFYKAERLGRQGKLFYMLKFRTMYWTGPEIGPPMTLEHDPRVTKIGAWLRRFKLDELPQLVNVLRGEMSLVGPRPEAPFYFQFYSAQEKELILSVRPGMTDYGSLRFHHEAQLLAGDPDPVNAYVQRIRSQKVQEQIRYIREQSLRVDVAVVLRTIATILRTRLGRRLKNRSIAQHAKIL